MLVLPGNPGQSFLKEGIFMVFNVSALKKELDEYVFNDQVETWQLSCYIHEHPEVYLQERKACAALVDYLQKRGFHPTVGVAGLETAFMDEFCPTGIPYPTIAILAEYDALPIGHACGHNIIAATAVGAAAALRKVMEQHHIPGTLRIIGTPAEEEFGGKIAMQQAGIFDGVDTLLLLHPTSGTTKIAGNCKSSYLLQATYTGRGAHAGSHPENGINAVDAAVICYTALGCLRNQLPSEVQVMPLILDGGEENGLVPDKSEIAVHVRCFKMTYLKTAVEKAKACIQAGALATGCTVDIKEEPGYQGRVCSHVLAEVVRGNLDQLKEPVMPGMVDDNGGEDFGNLNRVIPGVMVYPSLLPEEKISNHTPRFRELAISPRAEYVVQLGCKTLAYTALDLFCNPDTVEKAKEELKELQCDPNF